MKPTAGWNRRRAIPLLATGGLALVLALAYQWPGLVLTPDGWAYWEGSVSLLRGEGFRYFGGQPIRLWPPLFPLYLDLWQAPLGTIAGALAIAQAAALAAATAVWARLALPEEGLDRAAWLALPAIAGLVALFQRELASESLALLLVGAALSIAFDAAGLLRTSSWSAFAFLLAALLLTRHAALALVPGILAVATVSAEGERRRVFVRAIAAGAAAVGIWWAVRAGLGQGGSHPLVLPAPARFVAVGRGVAGRLLEIAGPRRLGIGALLAAGQIVLALAVVARRDRDRAANEAARLVLFAVLAIAATVLLVPVASPLEDRFGRFGFAVVPLLAVVPAKIARSESPRPLKALAWLLLVATAAITTGRAVYWVRYAQRAETQEGLAWSVCIEPQGARPGCVAPPDFAWIDRSGHSPAAESR